MTTPKQNTVSSIMVSAVSQQWCQQWCPNCPDVAWSSNQKKPGEQVLATRAWLRCRALTMPGYRVGWWVPGYWVVGYMGTGYWVHRVPLLGHCTTTGPLYPSTGPLYPLLGLCNPLLGLYNPLFGLYNPLFGLINPVFRLIWPLLPAIWPLLPAY